MHTVTDIWVCCVGLVFWKLAPILGKKTLKESYLSSLSRPFTAYPHPSYPSDIPYQNVAFHLWQAHDTILHHSLITFSNKQLPAFSYAAPRAQEALCINLPTKPLICPSSNPSLKQSFAGTPTKNIWTTVRWLVCPDHGLSSWSVLSLFPSLPPSVCLYSSMVSCFIVRLEALWDRDGLFVLCLHSAYLSGLLIHHWDP